MDSEKQGDSMTPAKLPALTVEQIQNWLDGIDSYGQDDGYWVPTREAFKEACEILIQSIRQPDAGATPRTDAFGKQPIGGFGYTADEVCRTALKEWGDFARQLERELAALSAPAGSRGWISVGERLPDNGQDVVLRYESSINGHAYRAGMLVGHDNKMWHIPHYEHEIEGKPTHWMPLPTAPEDSHE